MNVTLAAQIFGFFIGVVILFQLALALGMPWGKLAMGGKYPGRFPPAMRIAALIQILILAAWGVVVFAKAGIAFPRWQSPSEKLIWVVVAFNVVAVIANLATPSKWERILWAPVAVILLATSVFVAVGANGY